MIKHYLEQFLIHLIRMANTRQSSDLLTSSIREANDNDAFSRIVFFLEQNLSRTLTLDDICRETLIGRSSLQKLVRKKTGGGAMDYFSHRKVEAAKRMIRDGKQNFTEISRTLGFSSIHSFSRRFKLFTGMTPTEYASSVKLRGEHPQ